MGAHAAATLLLACIARVAAAHAAASCGGSSSVLAGHTSSGVAVCEDLRHNGSFVFQSSPSISLSKRVYAQRPPNTRWSEAGEHDALQRLLVEDPSGSLVSGAALIANASDPTYDAVFAMAPPIQASQFSSLRFTGSREARMDIIFDHRGGGLVWNGQPLPENVIAEQIDYNKTMEGLVGGELPIMHFVLAVDSDVKPSGWWEVTAVPQAENDGSHEQGCFYRFQRIIEEQTNETAAAGGEGATAALTLGQVTYFETYQYVAGAFTAEPEHFFDAMLVRTNERKPNHLFSFSINALTFPSRRDIAILQGKQWSNIGIRQAQRKFWDRTWAEEVRAQQSSFRSCSATILPLGRAKVNTNVKPTFEFAAAIAAGNHASATAERLGHRRRCLARPGQAWFCQRHDHPHGSLVATLWRWQRRGHGLRAGRPLKWYVRQRSSLSTFV